MSRNRHVHSSFAHANAHAKATNDAKEAPKKQMGTNAGCAVPAVVVQNSPNFTPSPLSREERGSQRARRLPAYLASSLAGADDVDDAGDAGDVGESA